MPRVRKSVEVRETKKRITRIEKKLRLRNTYDLRLQFILKSQKRKLANLKSQKSKMVYK